MERNGRETGRGVEGVEGSRGASTPRRPPPEGSRGPRPLDPRRVEGSRGRELRTFFRGVLRYYVRLWPPGCAHANITTHDRLPSVAARRRAIAMVCHFRARSRHRAAWRLAECWCERCLGQQSCRSDNQDFSRPAHAHPPTPHTAHLELHFEHDGAPVCSQRRYAGNVQPAKTTASPCPHRCIAVRRTEESWSRRG